MRIRFLFLSIAIICLFTVSAFGQTSASVVKIRPVLSVDKVKRGGAFQAAVIVDIDGAYHINSNRPTDRFLIATALKLDKVPGLTVHPVIYPRGKMKKFSFSDKPLSVYEGRIVLKIVAKTTPTLPTGNHALRGKLTVQACNDQACLQPKTIDVAIPLEVVPADAQVNNINGDIFGVAGRKRS